ncbi:MAG: ABC transporter permease [Solirubrobacterales bacterium]
MLALVLRGFVQRKLRVLLTGIAIALGVALMAGTYVLTDTINHSFAAIFQTANKGHDVVIMPTQTLGRRVRLQTSPITDAMLARVAATPGVAQASGGIFSPATLLDVHGKRLSIGGAPAFVAGVVSARFEAFSPLSGNFPTGPNEVALDQATATREHLKLGHQMVVAGSAQARRYTIVGIVKFGGGESFGGAGAALLTLPEAQRVVGEQGRYDEIDVAAESNPAHPVTASELRGRIRAVLPSTVEVRTGAQQTAKDTSDLESNLSFLRTFLLVFAYVSLLVGAFIIFNTFSITVAQRTREFGLLRTLGGSRRQIMQSVVFEGLLLGVVGAVLGLLGGIALAPGLNRLFKAFGADLPNNGTVLETRTIVVSLAVGISVTVVAGLAPAVRATRVPPLAAMREGVEIPPRLLTGPRVLVRGLIAAAVAAGVGALIGSAVVFAILFVTLAVYVTVLLARLARGGGRGRHRIVPLLARAIGALVRWRGITGRLAEENSMRQPGRTMVTAASLTVGLALVTLVAVLAAGTKATIDRAVNRSFAGDLIVENSSVNSEATIPAILAPALRRVPGVATVTPIAFTAGRVGKSTSNVTITAIDPETFGRVYRVEWKQGSNATLQSLGSGGTILTKGYASPHHLKVGQTISVLTPTDRRVSLRILGIASDNARLLGNLTISLPLARSAFGQRDDALDFVSYAKGVGNSQVQPVVNGLLASGFPQVRSRTAAQFKQDQANQINTLLTLIYVLLALSVIVSLFGIVNTLILSIYERTRELGMMRAIGTSRRQVRQMIRYESVITALIGGVFGLVIGIIGSVLVTTLALSGSGYVQSFPIGTLFILLLVAALAGILAAQLPARRAARLDMLQALASE